MLRKRLTVTSKERASLQPGIVGENTLEPRVSLRLVLENNL